MGVTPLDFSVCGNDRALRAAFEDAGFHVNCCMAMGDTFENMTHAYRAKVNVVVSSAGRLAARFMKRKSGMPYVEGLPVGEDAARLLLEAVERTISDGENRCSWEKFPDPGRYRAPEDGILVIGEEIFAKSLATAVNALPVQQRDGRNAFPLWPDIDEGLPEEELITAMRGSKMVIADPLYKVVLRKTDGVRFIPFPHEAYSGRIFRSDIPVFAGPEYSVRRLLQ